LFSLQQNICFLRRQIWMLSRLYCTLRDKGFGGRKEMAQRLLSLAKSGAEFVKKHARNPDGSRVYFALNQQGQPTQLQRKLFAECFFVMAMIVYGQASGDESYHKLGLDMFQHVLKY